MPDDSPRPNSLEARDAASIIHPLTNLKEHLEKGPVVIEEGQGVWVTDIHGKKYIEGMAGLWCLSLGYGQDRLVKAAADQMTRLPYYHLTNHKSHSPVIELAEKLLEMAPVPMSKIWFANSGSEGNDSAARIVWYYWHAKGKPEKRKIIAHERAYHGNTIASASLSGMHYNHASFGLPLDGFLHVTPPHHYRYAKPGESEEDFATRLADELDALIEAEGPDTVGAFFTEPIMGSGGVIVPPPTYYDKVQAVLDKHEMLLISDEVITAFGRTGNMFGTTSMGLKPDMIRLRQGPVERLYPDLGADGECPGLRCYFPKKATGSGSLVSASLIRAIRLPQRSPGKPCKIYEDEDILGHVRAMEPHFMGGLGELLDHPLVGEVRGMGLVAGVELVKDKSTGEALRPG